MQGLSLYIMQISDVLVKHIVGGGGGLIKTWICMGYQGYLGIILYKMGNFATFLGTHPGNRRYLAKKTFKHFDISRKTNNTYDHKDQLISS